MYLHDVGHMTNMAGTPIYIYVYQKPFLEQVDRFSRNSVCSILDTGPSYFVQINIQGWPYPILRQGQFLQLDQVLYVLCLYQAQISGERLHIGPLVICKWVQGNFTTRIC